MMITLELRSSLIVRSVVSKSQNDVKEIFSVGYTTETRALVKIYDFLPDSKMDAAKARRFDQIKTWLRDIPESKPEVIPKCTNVTKKIHWFGLWYDNGIRNRCKDKKNFDITQCSCRCEVDFFLFNDTQKYYDSISGDAILFEMSQLQVMGHPPLKHSGQIFVALEKESMNPKGVPLQNFEYVFNWTMTFRQDSDIFCPYGKIVKRIGKPPAKNYSAIYKRKKKGIIWFVSHCITKSKREDYATELSNYIDIDIIGKCGSDICPRFGGAGCIERLEEEYYFRFNLENSYHTDYVTEKLFENFSKDLIQIVGGAAGYDTLAPAKTVIDVSKFDSPADLATYLKKLMSSEELYTEYLKKKNNYYTELYPYQIQKSYCQLCSMLHDPDRYKNLYYSVGDWFYS